MSDIHVYRDDQSLSLTIEWNNRTISKDTTMTWLLPCFWGLWTACTLAFLWFARDQFTSVTWFILGIAVLVAVVLPFTWILRFTRERVELTNSEFRHRYVAFPWFNPVRWPLSSIEVIELGHHANNIGEIDAIATLSVRSRHNRIIVGYWVDDVIKGRIYREMDQFLAALNSPIVRRNTLNAEDMMLESRVSE